MHNYVLFNAFVCFIIQKLKNKHTLLKTYTSSVLSFRQNRTKGDKNQIFRTWTTERFSKSVKSEESLRESRALPKTYMAGSICAIILSGSKMRREQISFLLGPWLQNLRENWVSKQSFFVLILTMVKKYIFWNKTFLFFKIESWNF